MSSAINIISNDNQIIVRVPYNSAYVAKLKTIRGYRWHPAKKHWSLPDLDDNLTKLLKIFEGEKIYLDPTLHAKLSTPVIARSRIPRLSL